MLQVQLNEPSFLDHDTLAYLDEARRHLTEAEESGDPIDAELVLEAALLFRSVKGIMLMRGCI